jgi:hypothetical protein
MSGKRLCSPETQTDARPEHPLHPNFFKLDLSGVGLKFVEMFRMLK